ncbi:MAG: hypothetical protein A2W61_05495 [Deltaproteobacteria bacterium RIFCSPLOWO2_01_44_7]|nr:MAG: hypothetical protein A2712_07815 [Deltaproteobacteria bacterium RIFCSPHIGHO2_01_FULL_43_49]OGQ14753.1 MAG: hypothetical protein A3D22_09180 [Deltaproteobacteria bacterium RIFCSPHIGHO2_02_FULL_44_53]OGQ28139.1 MAG: hypothetical protein A3D98_07890 [Deltaproteobacteria bacterium RIFCSPHIGHO2_12_FULL_44_21]OGQ31351.1 MAG: hypothetical protein A2979_07940 [Deltaproteobacteria bacterium RIFCSPLOWO2_01_FULL_45_74]OGQ43343.1 MAG: hypothetical protein A3I70_01600 [Deltaproteobacteria bacterium 
MGDDFKIKETCAAIKEAGFQIDLNPYAEILTPDFNIFDPICEAMLQDSINLQKRRFPDRKAQIWTSSFIQTVDSYAKKYGFSVLILNPAHPFGSVTLATVGKNLVLGAGSTINFTESGLIFILDHEVGHFRDQNLLKVLYAEVAGVVEKGSSSLQEGIQLSRAYLDLFRRQIPQSRRTKFNELVESIFGDFSLLSIEEFQNVIAVLSEVLRYGEEIFDNRLVENVFSPAYFHLKKHGPSKAYYVGKGIKKKGEKFIDLVRLLALARYQESGLWEKFKKQPDYDPDSIKHLDPSHIEFFRMCIRAASHYFPVIYSRDNLPR